MDELLAELGIAPIGQDTDHQNSDTFSALHDDPLFSLDDSSGSIFSLNKEGSLYFEFNRMTSSLHNSWSKVSDLQ